jgi:hypothetical protein
MQEIKVNYDQEADVLYVSFGRSQHVTGVELADNILLRLDTGTATGDPPRAVGLTFISFSQMMAAHRDRPLTISLAVLTVITTSPVSDFLTMELTIAPRVPPLPERETA